MIDKIWRQSSLQDINKGQENVQWANILYLRKQFIEGWHEQQIVGR